MSYIPNQVYGSLYIFNNSTALNTSSGAFVQQTGWSTGDALNTTLSSSNITINHTGEVVINFNCTLGSNGGGQIFYYMGIYINGTLYNPSYRGSQCYSSFASNLSQYFMECIYSATYGDVIDYRIKPITGSDSSNRPIIDLANLSVVGL